MYNLSDYGAMVADRVRNNAYAQALRQTVRPGSVVLDIGTGSGIFAVLACQLGASRVFAIEPSEIIQLAREIASANHCADKIEFMEDLSTNVSLPVLADVIVSDLRGVLPLLQHHIPSIVDARRRFLTHGGTLIPRKDTIWAGIVEAPELYSNIVTPWEGNMFGQNFSRARQMSVNDFQKARLTPEQLLAKPQLWATLEYATLADPDFHGKLKWTVERPGTGHGILIWFDSDLADGAAFSNAPGEPETVYGRLFFPWLNPMPLVTGQTVCVDLAAKLMENGYIWRWTTSVQSAERPGERVARFEQSQLQGTVLSLAKLRKSASDYFPQLSVEGLIRRRTLEMMDGKTSLEEIARQLTTEFPERFKHWQKALTYAGALSQDFSR